MVLPERNEVKIPLAGMNLAEVAIGAGLRLHGNIHTVCINISHGYAGRGRLELCSSGSIRNCHERCKDTEETVFVRHVDQSKLSKNVVSN